MAAENIATESIRAVAQSAQQDQHDDKSFEKLHTYKISTTASNRPQLCLQVLAG